jgi:hypothetical protein
MKDIEVYRNTRSLDNVFEGEVVYHFTDDELQRLNGTFYSYLEEDTEKGNRSRQKTNNEFRRNVIR